jgi:nickel transport protein
MMKPYNQSISHRVAMLCSLITAWILMGLVFSPCALAHQVSIFAWVQGDTIHTQSKFMGGKRPNQALVEIFDETGVLLLTGRTDAQGQCSFPVPRKSDLKIVLSAGMGHRAVWTLSRQEFQEASTQGSIAHEPNTGSSVESDHPRQMMVDAARSPHDGYTNAEIVDLVESTLDKKLAPLMAKIVELDQKRLTFSDILGGLGYIVGLVGLAAYMQYHRKIRDKRK